MQYGTRNSSRISIGAALVAAFIGWAALSPASTFADDFEGEPIRYSQSTPANVVSRLEARLASGSARLEFEPQFGYLRSVLRELGVRESSQMLVFSKTSLQRHRIAPRTPRAVYFSDDVYVGFCQAGDVVEISAVDPQLGAVFYTLDQKAVDQPRFVRQGDNCLICHASSHTQGVPGHVVRSVPTDAAGFPILSAGSRRVDHTTPFDKRWGGWYVTGTHGAQKHLGNQVIPVGAEPERFDNAAGLNVIDLKDRLNLSAYLAPHSDLAALLVMEHQAEGHNLLARASFLTRMALHYEQSLNRELKQPLDHRWESTTSRIKSAAEPLVEYLLMSGEAKLSAPVRGTSAFADEFAAAAPRDSQGRSLRDLDLNTRLFKHPCSYLVYSPSFDALPKEVHDYVLQRLWDVLQGRDASEKFAHLTPEDRQAVREILAATRPEWPSYWRG